MRDGIGGTFMMYVLLIFLAVYITFVAVAFNYARAFRVKNKIIDIIEQNEGISDFSNTSGAIGQINDYLDEVKYLLGDMDCSDYSYEDKKRGYCISRVSSSSTIGGVEASYYKVRTFVRLEIPFLKLGFTFPISGETRKIERIS